MAGYEVQWEIIHYIYKWRLSILKALLNAVYLGLTQQIYSYSVLTCHLKPQTKFWYHHITTSLPRRVDSFINWHCSAMHITWFTWPRLSGDSPVCLFLLLAPAHNVLNPLQSRKWVEVEGHLGYPISRTLMTVSLTLCAYSIILYCTAPAINLKFIEAEV